MGRNSYLLSGGEKGRWRPFGGPLPPRARRSSCDLFVMNRVLVPVIPMSGPITHAKERTFSAMTVTRTAQTDKHPPVAAPTANTVQPTKTAENGRSCAAGGRQHAIPLKPAASAVPCRSPCQLVRVGARRAGCDSSTAPRVFNEECVARPGPSGLRTSSSMCSTRPCCVAPVPMLVGGAWARGRRRGARKSRQRPFDTKEIWKLNGIQSC